MTGNRRPTGDDLLENVVDPVRVEGEVLVPFDEMQGGVNMSRTVSCDHVYWSDEDRVYLIEPAPGGGAWKCCPRCGIQCETVREHSLPREIRERLV